MSDRFSLRPARPGEAAALSAIAHAAKAHWGYPAEWLALWRDGLTVTEPELVANWAVVAERGSDTVGFAMVERVDGLAELIHCWVLPGTMGQGLGRQLLAAARQHLGRSEPLLIAAEPKAEAFYHRFGARTIGVLPSQPEGRQLPLMLLQDEIMLAGSTVASRWLGTQEYIPTWRAMQTMTSHRNGDTADELWLLEHPPVFTQGQAGKPEHVLQRSNIPIVPIDRGGQVTYHGPGQLIGYLLMDLSRRKLGVREMVRRIEQSIIDLLADHGIRAYGKEDAPGVYVDEAKIASLGLRIRDGKCYHGLALNVDMDLSPFNQINPCGYAGLRVIQLADFGIRETPASLAPQLAAKINALLGQKGTASPADYALSAKPAAS